MNALRRHANACLRWLSPVLGAALLAGAASPAEPALEDAVPLDQLLKLPAGAPVGASIEKRGGSTQQEWEQRFRKVRADHEQAQGQLAATRAELEEKAASDGGQWRVSAPGLAGVGAIEDSESPLDYRLTQELRRNRDELAHSERRIQDLEVEANLAGVPQDWRGEPEPDG